MKDHGALKRRHERAHLATNIPRNLEPETRNGFLTWHLFSTDLVDVVNITFLAEEDLAGLIKRGLK